MAIVLSLVLIFLGIMEIIMGLLAYSSDKHGLRSNIIFVMICAACSVWCIGYALMGITYYDNMAYFFRGVALIGVTFACPLIVKYVQSLSGFTFLKQRWIDIFITIGGVACYFLVATPKAVTFKTTVYGYYYSANRWAGRYVQYGYLLILFFLWFYCGIKWYKRSILKREKELAKLVIWSGIAILVGVFFDTILPIFGFVSFPSSAMTTFLSVALLFWALNNYNSASMGSAKVSEYVFKNVSTPVVMLDINFKVTDCNIHACEYIGGSKTEIIGTLMSDWVRSVSDSENNRIRSELINLEPEIKLNITMKNTGNSCTLSGSVMYDRYGQVLYIICLLNDKTRMERMTDEVESSRKEAELANAAKKAFLTSMSVDITNPIKRVISACEELRDENVGEKGELLLNRISKDSTGLLQTVSDLLDISQLESGNFEIEKYKYDIRQLLTEVVNEIASRINEKQIDFIVQIAASVPRVLVGDKRRIKQVLINLLDNAVKYTKQGTISLSLNYRIRFGQVTLQFKVSDTGVGIREEDMDIIFGASSNRGDIDNHPIGTGLGLTISRSIVKLMGGEISVQSAVGKGTRFTFSIDQYTDSEKALIPFEDYSDNILIIDESQVYAESMEQMIRELGIECSTIIMEEISEKELIPIEDVTLVIVSASIWGRMNVVLNRRYKGVRFVPVYSFENYQKLQDDEEGLCRPLIFAQIHKYLR